MKSISKIHKLTKNQYDTLAWIAYVINDYYALISKDVERLEKLGLVILKKRYYFSYGGEKRFTIECSPTKEGKKYLRPSSILNALIDLAQVNEESISVDTLKRLNSIK